MDIVEEIDIPIHQLFSHPDNPRKELGDLDELADSIKNKGLLQPLVVVKHGMAAEDEEGNPIQGYRVIIGHRRMAASKLAGRYDVPCRVVNMNYQEQLETMLMENIQRNELTVYEQAQGFQQLLDFGATIEDISQKTGFSQTTIRRRVKMTELDQVKLKNISDTRQLNLLDFDELAKIENLDERNSVLEAIGTADFDRRVRYALNKQNIQKLLPVVKELLAQTKLKALKRQERFGTKWGSNGRNIYFGNWKEDCKDKILNSKADAYYLDEDYGNLEFYVRVRKPTKPQLTEAEMEREKAVRQTWAAYKEMLQLHYDLRREFVNKISYTDRNKMLVLQGALIAASVHMVNYGGADRKKIEQLIGITSNTYDPRREEKSFKFLFKEKNQKDFPKLVYYLFDDNASPYSSGAYEAQFPEYKPCWRMKALYAWLEALGYESSLEEQQLLDGSHEIYKRKDGYKV